MAHFLQTKSCHRLTFQQFDQYMHSCGSSSENVLCDRCSDLSQVIRRYILYCPCIYPCLQCSDVTVPQALRFDLPFVNQPITPTDPVTSPGHITPMSMSVTNNGELVNAVHKVGKGGMETLWGVISRVTAMNCIDCWVLGKPQVGPHEHQHSYCFPSILSALHAKNRENHIFWPLCHLCWVPFRPPCSHPSIARGDRIVSDDCPSKIPYLIPSIVTLIYLYNNESRDFLSQVSNSLSLQPPLSSAAPLAQFTEWVTQPASSPNTLPNFALFLITFSQCFDR